MALKLCKVTTGDTVQVIAHQDLPRQFHNEVWLGRIGVVEHTYAAMRFTVFDAGASAGRLERSLDSGDAKNQRGIVLFGLFPQGLEFKSQPIANGSGASLHGFRSKSSDVDLSLSDIAPLETKDRHRNTTYCQAGGGDSRWCR